ncbi:hypothetical protein GUJ93_ZPchr0002g24801 [Zizania palustris]|uniref:Uncharacterized protein n=1 Tax=Zizania palustris TaxID=103762 RepID=A0A8J5VWE1_ZIZPA|nr:hypothetical protein GUJ93_ZPchr0002g24801 [Zizania palustris]
MCQSKSKLRWRSKSSGSTCSSSLPASSIPCPLMDKEPIDMVDSAIGDICDRLEKCALSIKKYAEMKREEALEVLDTSTVEDHKALAEMLAIPSPERIPPWLHFEENGIEYDSDLSRGC